VIETSEVIRDQRQYYAAFESQIKGFQPTVQIHKLPGGAMGSSLEQAAKGGFLDKMPDILHKELPRVQKELGNYWSVTPGSQILWTTAVANVQGGERYGNPSGDLRNLLLGKYGPFPFYQPEEWIYEKVLGADWKKVLEKEGGMDEIADMDLDHERTSLTEKIGHEPTDQQLVLYLQHPNDAVNFFKFEEKFGKVYVLPPSIFLHQGKFNVGTTLSFTDHYGKEHVIEIGPSMVNEGGESNVYLNVDHHQRIYSFVPEAKAGVAAAATVLSKEEIMTLAKNGDIRAPFAGNICEISVKEGQEVAAGEQIAMMEAMKMQTPVVTAIAGIVTTLSVKVGDAVKPGAKIAKVDIDE
jgi:pyruvate carboxylase